MVFSSLEFLFGFLPVFLIVYYLLPAAWKNGWLLLGSLAFYTYGTWSHPVHLLVLLAGVTLNYALARGIDGGRFRKLWFSVGLLADLGLLFYFKYAAFFLGAVSDALHLGWTVSEQVLPLGISFFTFRAVSYLADVYRGKERAERSLWSIGNYFLLFPTVVSGPLVRYGDIRQRLAQRSVGLAAVDHGLREFVIGLGLKVLLADQIGKLWSDVASIGYDSISTPLAWMGLIAYSFQLYLDFYGYSRMAVGLGLMLGFQLPRNFCYPYTARSMTEFWRKWHMSLGQWFRDYVYIPLGGSREGRFKTFRNLFVVWLCTGLWHGADWNFLLWGLILFLLLAIEKAGWKNVLDRHRILSRIYMLLAIPLTWLVFAISDLGQLKTYFLRLFPVNGQFLGAYTKDFLKYGKMYGVLLVICALFCTPLPRRLYRKLSQSPWVILILLTILWGSLYCLFQGVNDPFMYFRF